MIASARSFIFFVAQHLTKYLMDTDHRGNLAERDRSVHLFLVAKENVSGAERSSGGNLCRGAGESPQSSEQQAVAVMEVNPGI